MNFRRLNGWLLGAIIFASVAKAEPPPGYRLVWSDEFNGWRLHPAKWSPWHLGKRREAVNVKEGIRLDGRGHLVLTTRQVGEQFQTAGVTTRRKYETTFGYFETRVQFQRQPGQWSAFWMMPANTRVGDPRQTGAEIDIFEYLAKSKNQLQHTLHWNGYGKEHQSVKAVTKRDGLDEGYHVVGLEWTPTEYVFHLDGQETWRINKAISHVPQHIILSMEVGEWGGDIKDAKLPDSVLFDYVRVYQRRTTPPAER